MSSPLRFSSRDRVRSPSNSSVHDKLNSDDYSRSYSPLLAPGHHVPLSPTASLSPVNRPAQKKGSYISSPPFTGIRGSKSGTVAGITPTQVSVRSPPEPSKSFFIPPPVTSYAYAQTKSIYDIQRNPLYNLQQQVKALTAELQELLDAQSSGLVENSPVQFANAEKGHVDVAKGGRSGWDGDVTSSVLSDKSRVGPKISLIAAREGIKRAMKALAEVKSMETDVYSMEEAERLKYINQVQGWESRRKELEEGIKEVEEGEEAVRVVELRKEREDVELEIRRVEAHLASLKKRHSNLLSSISSLESTLTSRASTYRQSLLAISNSQTRFFSNLPAKFRNHEIALEHWRTEADAMREKKEQAKIERDALNDGVALWDEAITTIRAFEEELWTAGMNKSRINSSKSGNVRKNSPSTFGITSVAGSRQYSSPSTFLGNERRQKMSTITSPQSSVNPSGRQSSFGRSDSLISSSDDEGKVPDDLYPQSSPKAKATVQFTPEESIQQLILKAMEEISTKLEEKVRIAESKNWKLLVCCLDAEAQAFREGRVYMAGIIAGEAEKRAQASKTTKDPNKKIDVFDETDDGVGLKSKFGRMELGSKLGSISSRHNEHAGIRDIGSTDFDMDDTPQNWGDIHDLGGVGLLGDEETREFYGEIEMTPIKAHNLSQSSLQGSSSSVSPKTPSRRGSQAHGHRTRQIFGMKQDGTEDVDRNVWDLPPNNGNDDDDNNEEENDDDNATVKGSVHEGHQFLKGPTVGQVMRRQGSSGGTPGPSGMVSSGPSGISLGLGTGWGRIRSPGIGVGSAGAGANVSMGEGREGKEGPVYGNDNLMLG